MIEISRLTKRYYDVVAIDEISFDVGKGEVVGFLGPNGAGKSTTLKILTCFMPATSGTARVAGLDVFRQSMAVRKQIGYLPEQVPLYGDMRIHEYLYFRGRLKGLSIRETKARIDEVCETCGLEDMRKRIVGQLSKGYRQRVGLADVLIHKPSILLLDEPTGGLDPSQRKEVRELIARLGTEHTILLSSHILAEVESVCTRVLIIKKGKIIADGKPETLIQELKGGERIRIQAACSSDKVLNALRGFPEGAEVLDSSGDEMLSTIFINPVGNRSYHRNLLKHLMDQEIPVEEFMTQRYTLEEIFMHLTVEEEVLSGIRAAEDRSA
ncbi:MAG: ABC transporter ATP-binding protein [Planctomycetota bacterium]